MDIKQRSQNSSKFREIFQNKHIIIPVIHVENTTQTIDNAKIAYEAGCDGVFLINMQDPKTLKRIPHQELLKIHTLVRKEFASWWIGINYLDLPAAQTFENVNNSVSGIWADNAQIYECLDKQTKANKIKLAKEKSGWEGLYFGSVAFKYQRDVDNPALAAKIAANYMDVVTTSGKATGTAPDIEKIRNMKAAIGETPLAIASGVSPENVSIFMPYADCFIVATSLLISKTEHFDKDKVKMLIDTVRGQNN